MQQRSLAGDVTVQAMVVPEYVYFIHLTIQFKRTDCMVATSYTCAIKRASRITYTFFHCDPCCSKILPTNTD